MKKYDIGQYIDTVKDNDDFFRNYYFHSIIDLNLVKLDYILKYGILSRKEIEELKYYHSMYIVLEVMIVKTGWIIFL